LSTPLFKDENICIYASTPNMADWVENFEIVYQIVGWIARNEALPSVINHGLSHYVHNIWDNSVFNICGGRNIEEFNSEWWSCLDLMIRQFTRHRDRVCPCKQTIRSFNFKLRI